MSATDSSRATSFGDPASAFSPSTGPPDLASVPRVLRPSDRQILALLGDHGVLTSGQLVVLSGMPERTVQYRLGRLERSGLLNRLRPASEVGTSPYHCWLTSFGAAAVGAGRARAWRDDAAAVQAVAARERGQPVLGGARSRYERWALPGWVAPPARRALLL